MMKIGGIEYGITEMTNTLLELWSCEFTIGLVVVCVCMYVCVYMCMCVHSYLPPHTLEAQNRDINEFIAIQGSF